MYTGSHHSPFQFSSSCLSEHIDLSDCIRDDIKKLEAFSRHILLCIWPIYQDKRKKYSVIASAKMCEAYKVYFRHVGDQDKSWTPHFTCEHCKKTLEGWYRGEKRAMKFAIPRIWCEPTDHSSNCYFCMMNPSKHQAGKNASAIMYPDLPSFITSVPHCPELSVPTPSERKQPSQKTTHF
ncbi:uncharacterized protein LOC143241082 [Tachypleus tridentatus]|uniref:uncharacterized protein LOC143241082 n=1 Tax=Tachypleus tridentatus TaxID=6853 RepID=UPI003FD347BB